MIKTTLLFFATALCEIIGCFLPWLWLKRNASIWLLLPAGISLAGFAPIFPDTCYHLTHYWPAAVDIPV
ncbi:hypothetical protein ACNITS_08295, partial [Escherichia coli]